MKEQLDNRTSSEEHKTNQQKMNIFIGVKTYTIGVQDNFGCAVSGASYLCTQNSASNWLEDAKTE